MNLKSLHIALRTYALALSLALGPSLVPLLLSYLASKPPRTSNYQASKLRRLLRVHLGLDGFALALSLSVGAGAAIREFWRLLDVPNLSQPRPNGWRLALSDLQKTFIANTLSSSAGILLLHSGRGRSSRRSIASPGGPSAASLSIHAIKKSNTSNLTLVLFIRAVDAVLQALLHQCSTRADQTRVQDVTKVGSVAKVDATKQIRSLTSEVDALVFWACSARYLSSSSPLFRGYVSSLSFFSG